MKKINWWNEARAVLVLAAITFVSYKGLVPYEITDEKIGGFEFGRLPIAEDRELPMVEWVLNEAVKAGLNRNEVWCLIDEESEWNPWAYNFANSNGTSDLGLWQINSCHKDAISVEDRFNYKTATNWAIAKILDDEGYGAWYGYRNGDCQQYAI